MFHLQDHGDAFGVQVRVEAVGDLFRQSFLDLQPACELLEDAGQFGQSEDAPGREVADVGDAVEGQQVVFAESLERQVAGEDQLVVPRRRWGTW